MRLQDERQTEGKEEDASNIDAHTVSISGETAVQKGAVERATYEDPSELDMETRLVEHTSFERWNEVTLAAGPERLRSLQPQPSRRYTTRLISGEPAALSHQAAADENATHIHYFVF